MDPLPTFRDPAQAFQYERYNVEHSQGGSHGVKESRGSVFVELASHHNALRRHDTFPPPAPPPIHEYYTCAAVYHTLQFYILCEI